MKKLTRLLEKPWASSAFGLCAAVILYMLLAHLGPILAWLRSLGRMLTPIVIGLVLAYLIDPVAKFFETRVLRGSKSDTRRRTAAVVIALLFALLILALFLLMVIPSFITSMSALVGSWETYYAAVEGFLEKLNSSDLGVTLDLDDVIGTVETAMRGVFRNLASNLSTVLSKASSVGSSLFNWAIGFILSIYFLMGKAGLLRGLDTLRRSALTPAKYESHGAFWARCHEIFIQYIGCNLLDALIIGVANAVFMLVCGLPYVPLVSVVVAVTNLLPTFGPFIGAAIGAFILVLTKPVYALWFLMFTVVLQLVDGYILKPRLFSNSFGLPAVWTLVSIILGGKLCGAVGMLLAIPVVAVLASLYQERFLPWLRRRRDELYPPAVVPADAAPGADKTPGARPPD